MVNKVYIAGPMTGIEKFNFPMFDTFRDLYKKMDYEVFSPADHDRSLLGRPKDWMPDESHQDFGWRQWNPKAMATEGELPSLRDMLGADLAWISRNATDIVMTPGWEKSNGARAEWSLAVALGIRIHYFPITNEILKELRRESRAGLVR